MKLEDSLELIERLIEEEKSKAFICKEVNCRPDTLNKFLKNKKIDYKGRQSRLGTVSKNRQSFEELAKKGWAQSHFLKLRLFADNLKNKCCEKCLREEWNCQSIPLELHHIDGNRFNNEINNLQILCPNCHAQTDNYSGKKNKKQ